MKLIILKDSLLAALNSVEKSITSGGNLPILKSFKMEAKEGNNVVLTSTDLEIAVEHVVSAKIIKKGSVAVPYNLFSGVVKNLGSQKVQIENKENKLLLNTDNYNASFICEDVDEYPIIPTIKEKKYLKINGSSITKSFSKTIIATQYSDIRPEINGLFLSYDGRSILNVGTDSFRLVEKKINSGDFRTNHQEPFNLTIPLKTAENCLKIFDQTEEVEISFDENQIVFASENIKITSRLVDGKFPDYKGIIPKETKQEILIDRKEFMNAVKTTKAFSGQTNDITLRSEDKRVLEVFSSDSSTGENVYKIPIKAKGNYEPFSTTLNWRYFLDGLKVFEKNEIVMGLSEPEKPILLKSQEEKDVIYIVMPIKS